MTSSELRHEIIKQANNYTLRKGFQEPNHYFHSPGGVVIFKKYDQDKKHGNFLDASFDVIMNTSWKAKFEKLHTHFHDGTKELDSCNSSDALLMNIFCHPRISEWKGIREMFGGDNLKKIKFGCMPKISKNINKFDNTEIDMCSTTFFVEAKLTEPDFTSKKKSVVESYIDFETVFDREKLNPSDSVYHNYQLIRNILTLKKYNDKDFYLICDQRRSDMISSFNVTLACVKEDRLKARCHLVFWQEITERSGKDLKEFLQEKYGF
ncbi:MAG: hypothetical protein ABSG15_13205 [FCB group bacterium]|jgi:hypothetical protein